MLESAFGLSWGIFIGFAIAVPVGPVGLICIQRTLSKNRASGLVSGLGAAFADALLASVGAFSITVIFAFITEHKSLLEITGGFLLFFLGIMSLISKPKEKKVREDKAIGFIEEFLSAFLLTITNPLSAFSFFIAFAAISEKIGNDLNNAIAFVIGAFIGSCLWWLLLTYIADKIAHKISNAHIASINKWFARVITLIGAVILLSVLFKQF